MLAKCCSERLDGFGQWLGVASLRSLKIDSVPEDLQAEPLKSELSYAVIIVYWSLTGSVRFD